MEKWQKDFFYFLETVADEVDKFFEGINETVETLFEFSEEVTNSWQNSIGTEIEQYLNELTEPFLDAYWDLEDIVGDVEQSPLPYIVDPTQSENPACIGCRNYHGQVYNGNILVCAMHPYGWDDEHCPDWEKEEFFF